MAFLPEKLRLAVGRHSDRDAAPDWVVLDLHGSYPTHAPAGAVQALLQRDESFESLAERLERLAAADWLHGVLVRVGELAVGLATARSIGAALGRLAASKRVVGYVPQVSMRSLLVTAQLTEVVAPESAEVMLPGFAAEQVFLGAFLAKHGITFENLRIREYKSASPASPRSAWTSTSAHSSVPTSTPSSAPGRSRSPAAPSPAPSSTPA